MCKLLLTYVIISLIGDVHCNICHSKSTIQKLGFLCGFIATNDEPMLLTIEGNWFKVIVHMTQFEFLDLPCPKQV
jgi:hypothetical protein